MIPSHAEVDGSLLSLLIQILTCPRISFIDMPRNNTLAAIWASLTTGKATKEISPHKRVGFPSKCSFLVGLGQADGSAQVVTRATARRAFRRQVTKHVKKFPVVKLKKPNPLSCPEDNKKLRMKGNLRGEDLSSRGIF